MVAPLSRNVARRPSRGLLRGAAARGNEQSRKRCCQRPAESRPPLAATATAWAHAVPGSRRSNRARSLSENQSCEQSAPLRQPPRQRRDDVPMSSRARSVEAARSHWMRRHRHCTPPSFAAQIWSWQSRCSPAEWTHHPERGATSRATVLPAYKSAQDSRCDRTGSQRFVGG
jgi:hypothetical protein